MWKSCALRHLFLLRVKVKFRLLATLMHHHYPRISRCEFN
uniref:Uncharacterized protein n=1 Tax=Rhizophora mucronata TaxID=61149 RepID=A0A2P2NCY3_RHIMU